jgi:hypothetical protein
MKGGGFPNEKIFIGISDYEYHHGHDNTDSITVQDEDKGVDKEGPYAMRRNL